MNQKSLFLMVVIILCMPFTASAMEFTHKVDVDNMTFQWKVDGDNLHVGLKAKTTSWIGIGFNPTDFFGGRQSMTRTPIITFAAILLTLPGLSCFAGSVWLR